MFIEWTRYDIMIIQHFHLESSEPFPTLFVLKNFKMVMFTTPPLLSKKGKIYKALL